MTLAESQISGVTLMGALSVTLFALSLRWGYRRKVFRTAGFMLAAGVGLLSIHFIIQYAFRIRIEVGVYQAALVNLVFYMPVSWLVNMSLLYLQCQGKLTWKQWLIGPIAYLLMLFVLIFAMVGDGEGWLGDTPARRISEYIASGIYTCTLLYYIYNDQIEFKRIRKALARYYDGEQEELITWTFYSMGLLTLAALLTPFLIFMESPTGNAIYGLIFFMTLFYYAMSFICYNVSNHAKMVETAEWHTGKEMDETQAVELVKDSGRERIDMALAQWVKKREYLKSSVSISDIADYTHLSRTVLLAWFKTSEYGVFSTWINYLRIEEAKRLIKKYPDWSSDTLADECGFNSRSYFLRIFKKLTDMTPTEWSEKNRF